MLGTRDSAKPFVPFVVSFLEETCFRGNSMWEVEKLRCQIRRFGISCTDEELNRALEELLYKGVIRVRFERRCKRVAVFFKVPYHEIWFFTARIE